MNRQISMNSEEEAFNHWRERHTHDDGSLKTPDKALVAAVNRALEELLIGPDANVTAAEIQSWILRHFGFGESILSRKRVDEHCRYESGEVGTPIKKFSQPKKNPTLRIVTNGVYALAEGAESYVYREISHRRTPGN